MLSERFVFLLLKSCACGEVRREKEDDMWRLSELSLVEEEEEKEEGE